MLSPSLGLARPAQIQGEPQNWGGAFSVPRTLRATMPRTWRKRFVTSERTERTAHFARENDRPLEQVYLERMRAPGASGKKEKLKLANPATY
jgi:hypothetical protein